MAVCACIPESFERHHHFVLRSVVVCRWLTEQVSVDDTCLGCRVRGGVASVERICCFLRILVFLLFVFVVWLVSGLCAVDFVAWLVFFGVFLGKHSAGLCRWVRSKLVIGCLYRDDLLWCCTNLRMCVYVCGRRLGCTVFRLMSCLITCQWIAGEWAGRDRSCCVRSLTGSVVCGLFCLFCCCGGWKYNRVSLFLLHGG